MDRILKSLAAGSALAVLGVLFLAFLAGCSSKKTTRPPDKTAAELTAEGWTAFEGGDLASARTSFEAAVAADAGHGPAYVGLGWASLGLAVSDSGLTQALTAFDGALSYGSTGADVRAGRSAVLLGLGGSYLADAAADAQTVLDEAPQYVFSHRTSFDFHDVRLILASAQAASGDFAAALAAAEAGQASGLDPVEPSTWEVGGTRFNTFPAAVLAYLDTLSAAEAG